MVDYFVILGAVGVLLIATGVLLHKRKRQDELYIGGGMCLLLYSISIQDIIFIVLQSILLLAIIYDISHTKK